MTRLVNRLALAAVLAALAASVAIAPAAAAPAAPAASVTNIVPIKIVSFSWQKGNLAWKQTTIANMPRTVFQFGSNGAFRMLRPGYAPVTGRYRVSGNTATFQGKFVLATPPTGETRVIVQGTIDIPSGRASIEYEAYQILVAKYGKDRYLNLRNHVVWDAELIVRRR